MPGRKRHNILCWLTDQHFSGLFKMTRKSVSKPTFPVLVDESTQWVVVVVLVVVSELEDEKDWSTERFGLVELGWPPPSSLSANPCFLPARVSITQSPLSSLLASDETKTSCWIRELTVQLMTLPPPFPPVINNVMRSVWPSSELTS